MRRDGGGGGEGGAEPEEPLRQGGRGRKRDQIQQLGGALSNVLGFKF